jgi:hypothetical protein
MSVTEKTVKVISGHFMFASEPSDILDRLQSAGIDVVPDDAMAEHGCGAPTLKRQGLYPCEAEIARRLSQSEKHWRRIAPQLERQGLPKIDSVMKGRFWPAVEAFFRNRHGLGNRVGSQTDGEEMWDVP